MSADFSIRESLGIELPDVERRTLTLNQFELRQSGATPEFRGYASVFDSLSGPIQAGGVTFREEIMRGGFKDVLATNPDVIFNFNHNNDNVLARTSSGTLSLVEDPKGLEVRAQFPETQWAKDLSVSIQRGDIASMSFAFRVAPGGESWSQNEGSNLRSISRVGLLADVSVVTTPAYPDADIVSLRSNAISVGDLWRDTTNSESPEQRISEDTESSDVVNTDTDTSQEVVPAETQEQASDVSESVDENTTEQAPLAESDSADLRARTLQARLRVREYIQ